MGSAFSIPCIDNENDVILFGTHLENKTIDEGAYNCLILKETYNSFFIVCFEPKNIMTSIELIGNINQN